MNRLELYNLIVNILPTYSAGQLTGPIQDDCCILRRDMPISSMNNNEGYWDNWTIDVYSKQSPLKVDEYILQFINVLRAEDIEIVNQLNGDYWDEVLKAFSTSLSFRIPKTLNNIGGK